MLRLLFCLEGPKNSGLLGNLGGGLGGGLLSTGGFQNCCIVICGGPPGEVTLSFDGVRD